MSENLTKIFKEILKCYNYYKLTSPKGGGFGLDLRGITYPKDSKELNESWEWYDKVFAVKNDSNLNIIPNFENQLEKIKSSNLELEEINYKINPKAAQGKWTHTPHIDFFDTEITDKGEDGYYISYYFSANMDKFYLVFAFSKGLFKKIETYNIDFKEYVKSCRDYIKDSNFPFKENLFDSQVLLDHSGTTAKEYQDGAMFAKCYNVNNLEEDIPDDETLINDLVEYLKLYHYVKSEKLIPLYDGNDTLDSFIDDDNIIEDKKISESIPNLDSSTDFLEDVFIDDNDLDILKELLLTKKNIIIQGPPGVGKTFIAKRLAYSIIGSKDTNKVKMVQFHQSYSYEDFIMGFRPRGNGEGFELKEGVFYKFCKKAEEHIDDKYFFIIDELNRGNLSKIFGELFMLIEPDKRGSEHEIQLLYRDELFFIPENVYIIGLMNTADRSLAMIDYALRRRFKFFDLKPSFGCKKFNDYKDRINNSSFNGVIKVIKELNKEIESDESLGEGFTIGHSFFCNMNNMGSEEIEKSIELTISYEIIPLLKEYWFDEKDKCEKWENKLKECF